VLVGRPALWGLAAGGEAGARDVLALLQDEITRGLGVEGEVLDEGEGVRLRVPDGESFVPRMFEHLTVGVRNVNVRRPSLDDVFIQYTGRDMRDAEAGGVDYQQFILPGVMAMSVLFSSLFSAISIVWDREFGFLREMLVAPVSRAGLVLGKAAGSGTVAAGQGLILLIAAPIVGVHLDALQIIEVIPLLILLAFALTAFGIVIASRMQRMESFQMVMGLVVNPMLFLSGAIFPLAGLATWLAVVTRLNPATYGIDPIRRVMLGESDAAPLTINGWIVPIWTEVLIVLTLGIAMLALAVRSFQKTE